MDSEPDYLSQTLHILHVDDDEEDYLIMRDLLAEIDDISVDVEWVGTVDEALNILVRNAHDLCLLDYYLGPQNGLDLFKQARAAGCQIPFVMLTGTGSRALDLEAMKSGITYYVNKNNLDVFDLERAVRYSLEHARLVRSIQELNEHLEQRVAARTDMLLQTTEQLHRLNLELEERVHARTAELEDANRELQAFSYSISHDLRAPLRSIKRFSQTLKDQHAPELPEKARHYVERVHENAEHMEQLITDLLEFSRLGREMLRKQTIDLVQIVNKVLAGFESEFNGRQIEVVVGDLPPCLADSRLMQTALENLLGNALKYTSKRESARIEVGSLPPDGDSGDVVYFVRDNGVGFDMAYVDKIFDVFQRLHSSAEFEGTGVGLAVVKRIIHRHGGKIWAEGKVNEGATFYFTVGR